MPWDICFFHVSSFNYPTYCYIFNNFRFCRFASFSYIFNKLLKFILRHLIFDFIFIKKIKVL